MPPLQFREAKTGSELRQIHALNHRTFAEEIAQHEADASGLLVDKLDSQNHYFIALREDVVVGMISAHSGPEFSVSRRLPGDVSICSFERPFEARLLAIELGERNRTVLSGLLWQAYDFAVSSGGTHLLISAITEREAMYRRLGFTPLGAAVPEGSASFVPMVMELKSTEAALHEKVSMHRRHWERGVSRIEPISLMPGPVSLHPRVMECFALAPVSHRDPSFIDRYEQARGYLRGLLPRFDVTIFPGAGTMANDIVAANLKAIFSDRSGLVLSNGEFGERLARQADRAGLKFRQIRSEWGLPWNSTELSDALDQGPAWIWAVHLETSTGVLNNAEQVLRLAERAGSVVALDCVSSLGACEIPNTSSRLLFASGVSGKSLGSYAGLAFVYLSEQAANLLEKKPLCPSFDLLRMREARGPVSTVASSSLLALASALELSYATAEASDETYRRHAAIGRQVRDALAELRIRTIAPAECAAPNITSFRLPEEAFPVRCAAAGYKIACESSYLKERGWGQIATMGHMTPELLSPLFRSLSGTRDS